MDGLWVYVGLWFYLDAILGGNIQELRVNPSHFHAIKAMSMIKGFMVKMESAVADLPFTGKKFAHLWIYLDNFLTLYIRINHGNLENKLLLPIALIKWQMEKMETKEGFGGA